MAMTIGSIGSIPGLNQTNAAKGAGNAPAPGFADMVKDAVNEVNNLQGNADTLAQKLATGDVQDVHQVMLALGKASSAFGLTVQVRNKAIEAYQEIMRMQV
jgi:flagellar hook-basal body complex protein FliE